MTFLARILGGPLGSVSFPILFLVLLINWGIVGFVIMAVIAAPIYSWASKRRKEWLQAKKHIASQPAKPKPTISYTKQLPKVTTRVKTRRLPSLKQPFEDHYADQLNTLPEALLDLIHAGLEDRYRKL